MKFFYIIYRDTDTEPFRNEGKQHVCFIPDWNVKTYAVHAGDAYHLALKEVYMQAAQKSEASWKQEGFKTPDATGGQLEAPGHWEDVERYFDSLMVTLINRAKLPPPPDDHPV